MKKLNVLFFGLIFTGLLITAGCNFELTTANIADVKVCNNLNGNLCGNDVAVFGPSDPQIVISCKLKNAPSGTLVTFTWKYVEGDPIIIDQVTLDSEDRGTNLDLHSSLSRPNNGWPTGKYAVEISIGSNDASPEVKNFEVR